MTETETGKYQITMPSENQFINILILCVLLTITQKLSASAEAPSHHMATENVSGNTHTITFSCSVPAENELFNVLLKVYQQAFRTLNHSFLMIYQPDKRSKAELLSGHVDGHCGLTTLSLKQMEKYPIDIINVEMGRLNVYSISRLRQHQLSRLDKLPTPLPSIVAVRGGTVSLLLKQHNIPHDIVRTAEMAFKMMLGHRQDVLVLNNMEMEHLLETTDSRAQVVISKPLAHLYIHPAMNTHYRSLIPKLEYQLKHIKAQAGGPISEETYSEWRNLFINTKDTTPITQHQQ